MAQSDVADEESHVSDHVQQMPEWLHDGLSEVMDNAQQFEKLGQDEKASGLRRAARTVELYWANELEENND